MIFKNHLLPLQQNMEHMKRFEKECTRAWVKLDKLKGTRGFRHEVLIGWNKLRGFVI